MKPRLLLDCDGILADFYGAAFDLVEDFTGVRHQLSDLDSWEIFASIGDRALAERTYNAMNEPGFCLERVPPLPGAIDGLASVRERVDLFIVTAPFRSGFWMHERVQWLALHFGVPADRVVFARHKGLIRGDFFADDNPHHVQGWAEQRRECRGQGFVWDQPYNRRELPDLPRLRGWGDLHDQLDVKGA